MKKTIRTLLLTLAMILAMAAVTLAAAPVEEGNGKDPVVVEETEGDGIYAVYKVNYEYLNVRAKRSTSSKLLGKLDKGQKIEVRLIKGSWARIEYGKGYAWVSTKYLKRYRDGWVKVNGTWSWYRSDLKKTIKSDECYEAHIKYQMATSKTKKLIVINKTRFKLFVFERKNGDWVPRLAATCNIGMEGHVSPSGTFEVLGKLSYFDKAGARTYRYCTRYSGRRYIHSTAYKYHTQKVISRTVGYASTHGCVSVVPEYSKYIYKNCPIHTKVILFTETIKK